MWWILINSNYFWIIVTTYIHSPSFPFIPFHSHPPCCPVWQILYPISPKWCFFEKKMQKSLRVTKIGCTFATLFGSRGPVPSWAVFLTPFWKGVGHEIIEMFAMRKSDKQVRDKERQDPRISRWGFRVTGDTETRPRRFFAAAPMTALSAGPGSPLRGSGVVNTEKKDEQW